MKKYILILTIALLSSCNIAEESNPYTSEFSIWVVNKQSYDVSYRFVDGGCDITREWTTIAANKHVIVDDNCIYESEDDFSISYITVEIKYNDSTVIEVVERSKFGSVTLSL